MRTTRPTTISLPEPFAKRIESQAKRESLTRSELLRKAFQFYVEEREWAEIYRFGEKQSRKLKIREDDIEQFVDEARK